MNSTDQTTTHFYVAANGNDAWSGTLPEPNAAGTDGPFATLRRARDAVRGMRDADGKLPGPVTVLVRGGKYYPERTLHLSGADSGTADAPVTYAAYPGENPVVSGGRRVTDWKPYHDGIYVTEVPDARGQGLFFRQLYANGQRQIRSRYPKADPDDPRWNGRWAHSRMDDTALESWPSDPRLVWDEPGAFPRPWAKPTQGEVYLMPAQHCWGDCCLTRIRSVDKADHTIRLAHGTRDFNSNPFFCSREGLRPDYSQFIVENLLEELTDPGEWCLDTEDGRLYFRPAEGAIEDLEVVIPVVKCLLHMERVEHVHVSGLTFTETLGGEPNSQYTDVEGVGALFPPMGWEYIGETVYLSDCVGCRLEHGRIVNVGGNGVYMRNGNEGNLIRHNEIAHVGGHGVALAGGRYRPYADPSLGVMPGGMPEIPPHPRFNEITDNAIHHTGLVDTYSAGVFLGLSAWNRVAHNDIHDVAHLAVSLGNHQFGRNCIEYNRIARAGRVTNDTGAINCWSEATYGTVCPPAAEAVGHVIRFNRISDTGNTSHGDTPYHLSCGVYLDNWTSNCVVYGNLVVNEAMGVVAKGRNNIVQNNLFVGAGDCGIALMGHASYPEHAALVSNNIFCGGSPQAAFLKIADRKPRRKVLWQCDCNLHFRPGDPDPIIARSENGDEWRIAAWREMSSREGDAYDANSLIADPLFVDAASGDYRLKPESPAWALGFAPIPLDRIGIRSRDLTG